MKKILLFLAILAFTIPVYAKDFNCGVTASWNGSDANGAVEGSLPVTIEIRDSANDALLSSATINSPVVNYEFPSFVYPVADNATVQFKCYAVAIDSAGNKSGRAESNVITLKGTDTVPPSSINVINIIIQ